MAILEPEVSEEIAQKLADRGHEISISTNPWLFGKGQIIFKHGEVFVAGSEPRADGMALAW